MKKTLGIAVLLGLTIAGISNASAIKTWVAETLRYVDLNANFAHIHDSMVGGHGARLVNADVSSSAAIAHTKLATPTLIPKLVGTIGAAVGTVCGSTPCTVISSSGLSTVTRASAGVYTVNFSSARPNAVFSPFLTSHTNNVGCYASAVSTSSVTVACSTTNTVAATDASFSFVLYDVDN